MSVCFDHKMLLLCLSSFLQLFPHSLVFSSLPLLFYNILLTKAISAEQSPENVTLSSCIFDSTPSFPADFEDETENTQISVLSIIIIIVIIMIPFALSWWSRRNHKRNDAHMDDDLVRLSFCSVFTSLFVIIFGEKVMSWFFSPSLLIHLPLSLLTYFCLICQTNRFEHFAHIRLKVNSSFDFLLQV